MISNRARSAACTLYALVTCSWLGCDLQTSASPGDEPDPPYQDLDAGDHWPEDTDSDADESFEPMAIGPGGDAEPDTAEEDGGECLDVGWDSYQVSGSCPGLPDTGAIVQGDDCAIEIPGELGSVIGNTGTVSGPHVTTDNCYGVAEVDDFPTLELTCQVDEASCQVGLSGGTSGW